MATQAEILERIAAIDERLKSGIESVTTDGTTTRVNLSELRKERDELEKRLTTRKMVRPVASRIQLGGF